MDSDDLLFSVDALSMLLSKIEEGYDYVNSVEYDEKRDSFMLLNGNVHGKIYRRSYLEGKNITFNDTRCHEDNFFNNHVILSGAKKADKKECTYYYVLNNKSITNNGVEFDRLEIYLSNTKKLLDIAKENHYDELLIKKFKIEKYYYLRRIYPHFNRKEKVQFNEWINEYDPEIFNYLELSREEIISKVMES